jgi:hypothetical protein
MIIATASGEFVTFDPTTSEAFWTTLPQGFGFAMCVWVISVSVGYCFRIVKMG